MMVNPTDTQGWTSSPDTRGTSDIIVTCLVTTFLCCWTSVYPNIVGQTEGYWAMFRDKLALASLGILGPDFLIVLATGQRSSARRSFRKFQAEGYVEWTITHSFFADMGGFLLEAPGLEHQIPVDAEQLFYLVKHRFVACPNVSKKDLDDRDKSDGLSRLIAVFQATTFVFSLIARGIQGFTVTTIELTTMSFVIILFGTCWCWKDKPSDVETSILLKSSVHIDEIVASGRPHSLQPYYQTPLDFISRHEPALNVMWQYYNDLARKFWFSPFTRRVHARPWDRIPGDRFLWMDFDLEIVAGTFILAFSSIFFIGWNSHFPTDFEKWAWRAASMYMMFFGVVGCVWMGLWSWILLPQKRIAQGYDMSISEESLRHPGRQWAEKLLHWRGALPSGTRFQHVENPGSQQPIFSQPIQSGNINGLRRFLGKTHNLSTDRDPHFDAPISFLVGTSVLCVLYVCFRIYVLTEDIVGLRSMPSDAYQTVNWLSFIPHV